MISTFPHPWNFNLTWAVHEDKTISKFPPPWNFKWTWTFHKDKMILTFPPPWNFKLSWTVHRDKVISKFPPHGTSIWLGLPTRRRWYQNCHPYATSIWLGVSTRIRWYQSCHPYGSSIWLGVSTRIRWYQHCQPPCNFKVTWTVHKDDDIKIATPWNFKLTWTVQHHLREVNMSFLVKRMQIWWVSYVSGTQLCSHFAGAGLEVATISHRGSDCKWIFRFKSSMLNNCNPTPFHHEFRISNSLFLCFPGF